MEKVKELRKKGTDPKAKTEVFFKEAERNASVYNRYLFYGLIKEIKELEQIVGTINLIITEFKNVNVRR